MTKQTIYLDLTLLTEEELKQIPVICDEFSIEIFSQNRVQFEHGTFNERMPFMFYSTSFSMFQCTFIRHHSKTEVEFSALKEILVDDTFIKEYSTAETVDDQALAIFNLLNSFELSTDQKLEVLSTTRKRLELVTQ